MVSKTFVLAGRASFVVENAKGDNVAITVKKSRPTAKYPEPAYFVSLRYNNQASQYAGMLNADTLTIRRTFKASADDQTMRIAQWALNLVQRGEDVPQGYRMEHMGRCGKCGRALTDEESIRLGLGPICRA